MRGVLRKLWHIHGSRWIRDACCVYRAQGYWCRPAYRRAFEPTSLFPYSILYQYTWRGRNRVRTKPSKAYLCLQPNTCLSGTNR